MNPDKLFDYLDGRLSPLEREKFEQQLASDTELQHELAMARQIHGRMTGESREVLLEGDNPGAPRERQMVKRIVLAFIVLVAINVGVGLWVIAHQQSAISNRKLIEARMREQLSKSLDQAAKANLTPAPLGVDEITISAASGKLDAVADEVVATAQRLGGTATKELPDNHRVGVLVDLAANRELEFRNALAAITGGMPTSPTPAVTAGVASEKKSFVVHVAEPGAM